MKAGPFFVVGSTLQKTDVIRYFAEWTTPVDLEADLVAYLQANGVRDQIHIWEVDFDSRRLRGKLVHLEPWEFPDDWAPDFDRARLVADIYIARTLDHCEKRLIVCKELLHVLDPKEFRVATKDDIERLIRRIVLPLEFEAALSSEFMKTLTDVAGIYEATAVLFPWAVRQKLLPEYQAGRVTMDQIADYLEIPPAYVYAVMSDAWPNIFEAFSGKPHDQAA